MKNIYIRKHLHTIVHPKFHKIVTIVLAITALITANNSIHNNKHAKIAESVSVVFSSENRRTILFYQCSHSFRQ